MAVIQHLAVDLFLEEMKELRVPVIRIEALDIRQQSAKVNVIRHTIGVHSRAVDAAGHVHSCYLPQADIEVFRGPGMNPTSADVVAYKTAWADSAELANRLRDYVEKQGFDVRQGLVDTSGVAVYMAAAWASDPQRRPAAAARGS